MTFTSESRFLTAVSIETYPVPESIESHDEVRGVLLEP